MWKKQPTALSAPPLLPPSLRQMFASQLLAASAHEKELLEARARIKAQRQLAAAQAQVGRRSSTGSRKMDTAGVELPHTCPPSQAAHRALTVTREKASNEAKSEFMSLMCHEVRTPLNGCLASAEMLLETPLQVGSAIIRHTNRRPWMCGCVDVWILHQFHSDNWMRMVHLGSFGLISTAWISPR